MSFRRRSHLCSPSDVFAIDKMLCLPEINPKTRSAKQSFRIVRVCSDLWTLDQTLDDKTYDELWDCRSAATTAVVRRSRMGNRSRWHRSQSMIKSVDSGSEDLFEQELGYDSIKVEDKSRKYLGHGNMDSDNSESSVRGYRDLSTIIKEMEMECRQMDVMDKNEKNSSYRTMEIDSSKSNINPRQQDIGNIETNYGGNGQVETDPGDMDITLSERGNVYDGKLETNTEPRNRCYGEKD